MHPSIKSNTKVILKLFFIPCYSFSSLLIRYHLETWKKSKLDCFKNLQQLASEICLLIKSTVFFFLLTKLYVTVHCSSFTNDFSSQLIMQLKRNLEKNNNKFFLNCLAKISIWIEKGNKCTSRLLWTYCINLNETGAPEWKCSLVFEFRICNVAHH